MPIIRNNLNSRILVHLKGGKSIDLLEKSTVEITDDDLSSSHLQDLIQRGFVIKESDAYKDVKKESGKAVKLENPKNERDDQNTVDKDMNKEKEENLNRKEEAKDKEDEELSKQAEKDILSKEKEEKCLNKEKQVKNEADENSALKKGSNTKKETKKLSNI